MLRLCCCPRVPHPRSAVAPSPPRALPLDLVADLPPHTRDSSALTGYDDGDAGKKVSATGAKLDESTPIGSANKVKIEPEETREPVQPSPRSLSLRVEDYSERSTASPSSVRSRLEIPRTPNGTDGTTDKFQGDADERDSLHSKTTEGERSPRSTPSVRFTPTPPRSGVPSPARSLAPSPARSLAPSPARSLAPSPARSLAPSPARSLAPSPDRSRTSSPDLVEDVHEPPRPPERDVRTALAECIVPARHDDWEVIVGGLVETERLAADPSARAPPPSWRAATRAATTHVRSLRSRVARAACSTLGALFEHRARALDPEMDEAVGALLERCADVNRFLRADATDALVKVACSGNDARAVASLARRGPVHRAGAVRAAAAQALVRLVGRGGAARALALPPDARTLLLRAAGELLGDASADARLHARHLCLALGEDVRFRPMLKEAMTPSRYRAIEKFVEKLRYR